MAQPVDFVGLNTFIYEVSAYNPTDQYDLGNLNSPEVETLSFVSDTSGFDVYTKVYLEQNHIGTLNATPDTEVTSEYKITCPSNISNPLTELNDTSMRFWVEGKDSSGNDVRVVFKWRTGSKVTRKGATTYFLPAGGTDVVTAAVIIGYVNEAFQMANDNGDVMINSTHVEGENYLTVSQSDVNTGASSPDLQVVITKLDTGGAFEITTQGITPSIDPLGEYYSNMAFQGIPGMRLPTSASVFPALMLRRNGPFGWPTWRQIRTSQNPLVRRQIKGNVYTLLDRPKMRELQVGANKQMVLPKYGAIKAFVEPPITTRYYPLSWNVANQVDLEDGSSIMRSFNIETSLGNESESFINPVLNNILGLSIASPNENYSLISSYYLDGALEDISSPIDEFEFLSYRENVYPREVNTYRAEIRVRKNFSFPWKANRPARNLEDQINYANTIPSQSMWPLDGDIAWETRPLPTSWKDMRTGGWAAGDSTGSEGLLQNQYSLFTARSASHITAGLNRTDYMAFTASAFYSRPNASIYYLSNVAPSDNNVDLNTVMGGRVSPVFNENPFTAISQSLRFQGQVPWTAPQGAGYWAKTGSALEGFRDIFVSRPKQPFYESYENYAENIRGKGQSYTLVPEYRASSHVADFEKSQNMNDNLDIFELTGAYYLNKSDSSNEGFYTTYSNSDFLKFFQILKNDHDGFVDPARITLTCKAVKKFLPYEGFYPAQRTAQITQQFWDSYKDNISTSGSGFDYPPGWVTASQSPYYYGIQAIYTPLFAPGVLYNSIKSGVAVDYPLYNSSSMSIFGREIVSHTGTVVYPLSAQENKTFYFNMESDAYDERINFESLCYPRDQFASQQKASNEPCSFKEASYGTSPSHYSESYCAPFHLATWNGLGDDLYIKMVNNFVGEVPNFFLPEGRLTSFASLPQGNPNFGMVKDLELGTGNSTRWSAEITFLSGASTSYQPDSLDYVSFNLPLDDATTWPYYIIFSASYEDSAGAAAFDTVFDMDSNTAGPVAYLCTQTSSAEGAVLLDHMKQVLESVPYIYNNYTLTESEWASTSGTDYKTLTVTAKEFGSEWTLPISYQVDASGDSFDVYSGSYSARPYGMRINMRRSTTGGSAIINNYALNDAGEFVNKTFTAPQSHVFYSGSGDFSGSATSTFTMYSRPTAFGPESSWDGATLKGTPGFSSGYNWPYTPPYYHGQAWLDLYFTPSEAKKYSLSEILSSLTASYSRMKITQDYGPTELLLSAIASISTKKINNHAMQLSASVIFDGSAEKQIVATNSGETEVFVDAVDQNRASWVIQTKWESPTLDFSYLTDEAGTSDLSAIPSSSYGNAQASRGMWHQYGRLPLSASQGIFLSIEDIPEPFPYMDFNITGSVKSLADLVGFPKTSKRIGDIANAKVVKEAVVAIPYSQESGKKKFYNISKALIKKVLQNKIDASVGPSITDMVHKMKQYNFPPSMDFVNNPNIDPFAMYIFEFKHQFSKIDLADMWQNLPPDLTRSISSAESTITHEILSKELLSDIDADIRWLVFKVKQKANTNYYDNIAGKEEIGKQKFDAAVGGRNEVTYNWPYDFFSLVELVKIDAQIDFAEIEPEEEFVPPPAEPEAIEDIPVKETKPVKKEPEPENKRTGPPPIFQGQGRGRGVARSQVREVINPGGGRGGGNRGGGRGGNRGGGRGGR